MRKIITRAAQLKGMGYEVNCTVMMTEVSQPGFPPAYCKLSIHNEPKDLPDGTYEIFFTGNKDRLRKQNGFWLAAL
jgi:hypothetical protein